MVLPYDCRSIRRSSNPPYSYINSLINMQSIKNIILKIYNNKS